MKYTVTLNQLAGHTISAELGVPLDITDLAIFEVMVAYSGAKVCAKMQQNDRIWYNIPYADVIRQLPLGGISSPNAMYKRYKRLEAALIIKLNPNNAKMNQVWLTWGANYERMLFKDLTPLPKSDPLALDKGGALPKSVPPLDENQGSNNIKGSLIGTGSTGKPAPSEKKPALIHLMVAAFEDEHRKHFLENGQWVGFNWGAAKSIENGKEFGALKSLKTKLEKRVRAKRQANEKPGASPVEISEEEILNAFRLFIERAARDKWVLDNAFTPSALNSQFQMIIQKIHAGSTAGAGVNNGKPSISETRKAGLYEQRNQG